MVGVRCPKGIEGLLRQDFEHEPLVPCMLQRVIQCRTYQGDHHKIVEMPRLQ